ncbi:MAG: hypothetical protein GY733_16965 [bacterium]|nr:hypothetical protein [bacterium]
MREASERRGRGEPLRVPDPRNYTWLAAGLDALGRVAREPGLPVADAVQAAARERKLDPQLLARTLGSIGALEATEKLIANRGDLHRSLNENFDALATLRLLHALRDAVHPDVALADAVAEAPFLDPGARTAWRDLEAVRNALVKQEKRCLR